MTEWLAAPLESAMALGDADLSEKLLQAGARASIEGASLHEAVRGGHTAIVDLLLERGASPDEDEDDYGTPLHVAAEDDRREIAALLLGKGADVDAEDGNHTTPLTRAMEKGHYAMVEILINSGVDLAHRVSEFELSALDLAAYQDRDDFVRLIIEHGADVNAAASNGCTALHRAAEANRVGVIHLLAEAGADLDAGDSKPLHYAAGFGFMYDIVSPEAVLALLNVGAEVNAQTRYGETALHKAASRAGQHGSAEAVKLLLRWGADETIVSARGKTAADNVGARRRFGREAGDDDDELVRTLLARAPADRAWRRRGLLVLCRAYPDRLQLEGDLAGVAAKVFGLVEVGVFRKIVLYL